ncbi:penicillin-binding protein 2, partial [Candidatus Pacearchaeota archaeon]|nr:penicillin-binding protein 2 [Candidatus Pacearchaeota archaeon]
VLRRDAEPDVMAEIINEKLSGVFVDPKRFMIYGDPTLIPETQLTETSQILGRILESSPQDLEQKLTRRKVRYVFLRNRIEPEISRKIRELKLKGVVLLPEHWRYYPEGDLAPHVVGFLNREEVGQYGIEGYFNTDLEGKKGTIYAEKDPLGRQITVGSSEIVNAVDGDTIVLTIDRIIQKKVEEILAEAVEQYSADSGQVLIMNPFTGAIVAMANYPSFNPNEYTDVFALRALEEEELVESTVPLFKMNEKGKYVPVDEEDLFNEEVPKYVYENKFGPSVFKNRIVSEYYEPGSVFKPIVMAMALDAKEVEPQTTFLDDGPLKIDEFEIKNADGKYRGETTMNEVLAFSMNTGMSFVSKKLGKKLMYEYLMNFGFGEYTNIRLEGEAKGIVDYYKRWSKAQMLTTSFGQGIVATPLQVLAAWSALANGGKLMQPFIIDSIIRKDEVIQTEPQIIKRVVSEETSSIITSMLINSVRNGVARPADIPGYLIAGKTGTSQVAGKSGKYLEGEGSTITSFAGYAPALEPRFIMIVKFDRPRIGENTWGSTTAAPTFRAISEFMMDYYNIQATD